MTTYTTPDSLPIIEPTADRIKDGAEVSALAGDISALATATQAALADRAATAEADATTKADAAKAAAQEAAINDATTKYGGLPARVTALEVLRPVKAVRLEAGKWVWDLAGATHYLLPDETGALVARATPWPVPNPITPSLDW